jgi:hypothetical protein
LVGAFEREYICFFSFHGFGTYQFLELKLQLSLELSKIIISYSNRRLNFSKFGRERWCVTLDGLGPIMANALIYSKIPQLRKLFVVHFTEATARRSLHWIHGPGDHVLIGDESGMIYCMGLSEVHEFL